MLPGGAQAAEWFVAPGGTGSGTKAAPFGRIQDAVDVAMPGDTVTVMTGTYVDSVRTVRDGMNTLPIRIRAAGARGSVVIKTAQSTVVRVSRPYHIIEGLVFDGDYGAFDTILVESAADSLTLRNVEVRRSSKDLVDIRNARGVLIEDSLLHHALNATNGRTDAHGVVAGAVQDLTIRRTEIHTFSGDGLQLDPARAAPGWGRVTIEDSRIWLAPLSAPTNGFAAGVVPGENAVDTKSSASNPRATLAIRNTIAWGFRDGLITNTAAFNIKENVDVTFDRVTVYDSYIAFRLRGPGSGPAGAWATIKNAVVYNTTTAFRYEDNIESLKIWNCTVGRGMTRTFQAASSAASGLDVRNLLVLGTLPKEAIDSSNRSVGASAFVNAAANNYALATQSPAVDTGTAIPAVTTDRQGTPRPQGAAYDVGAYELASSKGSGNAVAYAATATAIRGAWQLTSDTTAAGGARLWHPNARADAIGAQSAPAHYFEVRLAVEGGKPYRLWLRGLAEGNSTGNDSAWVQFSGSVDADGDAIYRIGTTSATRVVLENCASCGVSGWGWQDNGYGLNVLGPVIRFASSGLKRVRVQTREDGLSIDQIVLSATTYLSTAPGVTKNDMTILPLQ
jgi:hypothetical protein